MEKKVISLSNQNYNTYLPLDPISFSYAERGAMGWPGKIIIIDTNRNIYDFYIYDFEIDIIKLIIPDLFECEFRMFGKDKPASGWHNFYLGMGNHLMVKESIYHDFYPMAVKYDEEPGMLYQEWIDIVLDITKK